MINIQGYKSIDEVVKKGITLLNIKTFETFLKEHCEIIIDIRDAQIFTKDKGR